MLTLIIGGSASGKSEYAERHVLSLSGTRIYLATMEPFGEEAKARIMKHQAMRRDRGFETIECCTRLPGVQLPPHSNVLLEDLGNLLANELYSEAGGGAEAVKEGIDFLLSQCEHLTVVTNDVFSGGKHYSDETIRYMKELAGVNRYLAEKADLLAEIVCGLPNIIQKTESSRRVLLKEKAMIFVTGPLFAGKQEYIQKAMQWTDEDFRKRAVRDVEGLAIETGTLQELSELAEKLAEKEVVIATEIGGGIVPADPKERREREAAGNLSRLLSGRAETVIRVCCGLPQILKGELP